MRAFEPDCIIALGGGSAHRHHQICINDCHIRQELVVRKRVFYAALLMDKKKVFIVTDEFLYKNGYTKAITDKLDSMGIALFVGNNGKRSHFRTSAGRGRNCNKVCLGPHFRESIYSLADIQYEGHYR